MFTTYQKVGAGVMATALVAALAPIAPANAGSSQQSRWTHSSCEGSNAVCGVLVIANGGVFTLDWTSVTARSDQPGGAATHPSCPGLDKKIKDDVPGGNYNTFVIPASCAYKIKIKILSGNSKDQNLYLTPGCQLIATVKGDLNSNSWKSNKATPLNDQVPTVDGHPVDALGYKCGKQSNAGF